MKILMLSHKIGRRTPLYRGRDKVELVSARSIKKDNSANVLRISMNTHTSTHIDMPFHFIEGGKSITDYGCDSWIFGNVSIVDMNTDPGGVIDKTSFADREFDRRTDFLVIKTNFEKYRGLDDRYIKESPVVSSKLAGFLKKKMPNLRAIGFDFISLSSMLDREEGRNAHRAFLKKDILIIEDMKLAGLKNKPDSVLVSPLFIEKADGSPVSVWAFYGDFTFGKYDYIFFDFDGVIVDSEPVKIGGFVKLYERYGRDVTDKIIRHHEVDGGLDRYRKFKLYHNEFLGLELNEKKMTELSEEYSRLVLNGVLKARYIDGAPQFLKLCKGKKKTCFLVSSTPEAEIKKIARIRGISGYFKNIKGSPADKKNNIEDLIKKYGVDRRRACLFGDSANDLRAADYNGIKFIGINYPEVTPNYKNFDEILSKKNMVIS